MNTLSIIKSYIFGNNLNFIGGDRIIRIESDLNVDQYSQNKEIKMGNEFNKQLQQNTNFLHNPITLQIPLKELELDSLGQLPPLVKHNIDTLKPYQKQMEQIITQVRFEEMPEAQNQFYRGQKNQSGNSHGYGQIVFENGSTFIGQFEDGKAQPKGFYLMTDGSYYHGDVKDSKADGEGQYVKDKFIYRGHFENNFFHGQGIMQVGNRYQFDGQFERGKKKKGKLIWYQDDDDELKSQYEGPFNENQQFEGVGVLINKLGKYKGEFKDGVKYGDGRFEYSNGLLYIGKYVDGLRHGFGTIFNVCKNKDDEITYEEREDLMAYGGQFFKGMPHGKGSVYNEKEKRTVIAEWDNGVCKN